MLIFLLFYSLFFKLKNKYLKNNFFFMFVARAISYCLFIQSRSQMLYLHFKFLILLFFELTIKLLIV